MESDEGFRGWPICDCKTPNGERVYRGVSILGDGVFIHRCHVCGSGGIVVSVQAWKRMRKKENLRGASLFPPPPKESGDGAKKEAAGWDDLKEDERQFLTLMREAHPGPREIVKNVLILARREGAHSLFERALARKKLLEIKKKDLESDGKWAPIWRDIGRYLHSKGAWKRPLAFPQSLCDLEEK